MFINGGIPTIYVSDMNRAVEFYTARLGLALKNRAGDEWAEIDAGNGMIIGLHITSNDVFQEMTKSNMTMGLHVDDHPIEEIKVELEKRGIDSFGDIHEDGPVKTCHFKDPDGNVLYLCENVSQTAE